MSRHEGELDLGYSRTEEQTREAIAPTREAGGTAYQTCATTARGPDLLMGSYPILDRTPKGRDEGDATQTWN